MFKTKNLKTANSYISELGYILKDISDIDNNLEAKTSSSADIGGVLIGDKPK